MRNIFKIMIMLAIFSRFSFAGEAGNAGEALLKAKIERFTAEFFGAAKEKDLAKFASKFENYDSGNMEEVRYYGNFFEEFFNSTDGIEEIELKEISEKLRSGSGIAYHITAKDARAKKYNTIAEMQYSVIYGNGSIGVVKIKCSNILGDIKVQYFYYSRP